MAGQVLYRARPWQSIQRERVLGSFWWSSCKNLRQLCCEIPPWWRKASLRQLIISLLTISDCQTLTSPSKLRPSVIPLTRIKVSDCCSNFSLHSKANTALAIVNNKAPNKMNTDIQNCIKDIPSGAVFSATSLSNKFLISVSSLSLPHLLQRNWIRRLN